MKSVAAYYYLYLDHSKLTQINLDQKNWWFQYETITWTAHSLACMSQLKDFWKGDFRKRKETDSKCVFWGRKMENDGAGVKRMGQDLQGRKHKVSRFIYTLISYWIEANVNTNDIHILQKYDSKVYINSKWLPFVRPGNNPTTLNLGKGNLAFPLRSLMPARHSVAGAMWKVIKLHVCLYSNWSSGTKRNAFLLFVPLIYRDTFLGGFTITHLLFEEGEK